MCSLNMKSYPMSFLFLFFGNSSVVAHYIIGTLSIGQPKSKFGHSQQVLQIGA